MSAGERASVVPKLTHIKRALVVTTSHAPTEILQQRQGNMIENQVIGHMLETIGVSESKWLNLGGVQQPNEDQLKDFTPKLKEALQVF